MSGVEFDQVYLSFFGLMIDTFGTLKPKNLKIQKKKIQNYEYVYAWSYLYFRVNIPCAVRIPAVNPGVGFGQLSRFQTLAFQFIQPYVKYACMW